MTLEQVIEHIKTHNTIKYKAPLDSTPHRLNIQQYTIDLRTPSLSKMTVWTLQTKTLHFMIAEHLERFSI